jgi:hypothetical protein
MGERVKAKKSESAMACEQAMLVQTLGGRMHVRWDETAQATPHGQLVFFAEFLATAGVFDRWVQSCPLSYSSPNASGKREVLGTLMLGILAGSRRYAHIASVHGDAVAAQALGLKNLVSADSVRRGLSAIEPLAGDQWMQTALMDSVRQALDRPWILDVDATIKPLYGKQQGAEVGYNLHKPGRPSHVLHTYWVGNLRLVLDAVLTSGKQHASAHAKAPLQRLLHEMREHRPVLVRGDCGYGNEGMLDVCEQQEQRYLLPPKRRSSTAVRYSGMPNWYLPVITQACASSVSNPLGMMRAGAGATFRPRSQHGQAYLMRWCWMTRTCSGITCICSLISAPISTRAWPSWAQTRCSCGNSWRTMSRGNAGSSGLRPRLPRW